MHKDPSRLNPLCVSPNRDNPCLKERAGLSEGHRSPRLSLVQHQGPPCSHRTQQQLQAQQLRLAWLPDDQHPSFHIFPFADIAIAEFLSSRSAPLQHLPLSPLALGVLVLSTRYLPYPETSTSLSSKCAKEEKSLDGSTLNLQPKSGEGDRKA